MAARTTDMTLYVTDLDGTLLRNDASISDFSVKTLNSLIENGVLFTYATARSFTSAAPLIKQLNLDCPAVTFNGVFVINPQTGEHLIENVFTKKSLKIAKKFLCENDLAPLVYSYINGEERVSFLGEKIGCVRSYINARKGDKRLRKAENYDELFEGNVFYITVLNAENTELLDSFFTEENGFAHNFQHDTYDDTTWYEIYDKNAGKAAAVRQVKALLNVEKMVCFGDNKNDIEMLKAADLGVAVGNSFDELKEIADIIIEENENDAIAKFIEQRENITTNRFKKSVDLARTRIKSTVGTQNEKLIHAALKNYYAPFSDEQEVKIGNFFADAVNENGIFEIQTKQLYRLREKLSVFLENARVNLVHPFVCESKALFVNAKTGEIVKADKPRKTSSWLKIFEELYSIKNFLQSDNLKIVIVKLKIEKIVYFEGESIPDLRSRNLRKKCVIEKIPTEIVEEICFETAEDFRRLLPENLPESFTKKEFCKACGEANSSLRLEILRETGIVKMVGKRKNAYVYEIVSR